jgi:hypothetical protein
MLQELPALKDLLAAMTIIILFALTLVAGVFLDGWYARRVQRQPRRPRKVSRH